MEDNFFAEVKIGNQWEQTGSFTATEPTANRELEQRGLLGWHATRISEMVPMVCSCGRFCGDCAHYYNPAALHGDLTK